MKSKTEEKIKYFNMEEVTISGFYNFCKKNLPLILAVSIMLFFAFGIKLFWNSIGIDTEIAMANKDYLVNFNISLERFSYPILHKLLYIKEFNPFIAFFMTFCLIWFFTISWCYIISIFSRDTSRNNKLIPFALVFMTMPVWAECFYFLFQSAEVALIISLCPYVIYNFYKGFLDNENGKIICAFILLIFMVSIYQSVIVLFCCGVFACFLLLQDHSDYEPAIYRRLCLKLFIALIGAMIFYSLISRGVQYVLRIEKTDYLDNMNLWKQRSIKEVILHTLLFCYNVTIGHISVVKDIIHPYILKHTNNPMIVWGIHTIDTIPRIWGNALLLPVIGVFLVKILFIMRNRIPSGRRLLYMLAGIGVPLSIIFLTIISGGNRPPLRSLFVLPLAFAFMFFYCNKHFKGKAGNIIFCFALFAAVYQAQITAQLFYSDQKRYNDDVRLAFELEKMINQESEREELPVIFIGKYRSESRFDKNFLRGEVVGESFFEHGDHSESNYRIIAFMDNLGIHYRNPNSNELDYALKEAILMPSYPDSGCVKKKEDIIVVKLSETEYPFSEIKISGTTIAELLIPKDAEKLFINDIVSVDIMDDGIVLYCGNVDPHLYLPLHSIIDRPFGKPFIEITYTNSQAGFMQVFYDYGNGLGENNNFYQIEASFDHLAIQLPIVGWDKGKQLVAIRIDPPNGTEFMIKSIKILSAEDE
jgi:hypothetical protein